MDERQAWRVVKDIQSFAVARDGDDAKGSRTAAYAKRLCRGLVMHEGLEPLLQRVGGVEEVLMELERRSQRHSEVFHDISKQHAAQRQGEEIDIEEGYRFESRCRAEIFMLSETYRGLQGLSSVFKAF